MLTIRKLITTRHFGKYVYYLQSKRCVNVANNTNATLTQRQRQYFIIYYNLVISLVTTSIECLQ